MIPEYRLIKHLLNLKSNYFFFKEIIKAINSLTAKTDRNCAKKIFFNNKQSMFVKMISVYLYFNHLSFKDSAALTTNFALLISALTPIFICPKPLFSHYEKMQDCLLALACENQQIKQWYVEAPAKGKLPPFLVNNPLLLPTTLLKIKTLVYISGQVFANLDPKNQTNEQQKNYRFGEFLMLFYLLDLETRQTWHLKKTTNWNLKALFANHDLFTNKLMVLDQLITILMEQEQRNFNLYIRIMNYTLSTYYQS